MNAFEHLGRRCSASLKVGSLDVAQWAGVAELGMTVLIFETSCHTMASGSKEQLMVEVATAPVPQVLHVGVGQGGHSEILACVTPRIHGSL